MWNRVLIGIEKKKLIVHKKGCVRKTKIYLIIKNYSTLWEIINFLTQSIFKASSKESTWKGIIIVPVHKIESKNLMKNYRVISLFRVFSRTKERYSMILNV